MCLSGLELVGQHTVGNPGACEGSGHRRVEDYGNKAWTSIRNRIGYLRKQKMQAVQRSIQENFEVEGLQEQA